MDMKEICRNQIKEALLYKWIKGEKLGYDPGNEAINEWIEKYAKKYREEYKDTYEKTLEQVWSEVKDVLKEKTGIEDEKILHVLMHEVCDKFTEVWVKDVAETEQNNAHLNEI
jgi:hypothetical protein